MTPSEIVDRHSRPLLELIADAREQDWPDVADRAALLHTLLMVRRQGGDPYRDLRNELYEKRPELKASAPDAHADGKPSSEPWSVIARDDATGDTYELVVQVFDKFLEINGSNGDGVYVPRSAVRMLWGTLRDIMREEWSERS